MPQHRRSQQRRRFAAPPQIGGPHELGQNWLVDRRFPAEMAEILRHAPPYPVLELGAGNGSLTEALVANGAAITALELDPRRVDRLRRKFAGRAEIVEADMLTFDFGPAPHHVIANVPFSLTTPLLRRCEQELSGSHFSPLRRASVWLSSDSDVPTIFWVLDVFSARSYLGQSGSSCRPGICSSPESGFLHSCGLPRAGCLRSKAPVQRRCVLHKDSTARHDE
jgi:hypothetical protein